MPSMINIKDITPSDLKENPLRVAWDKFLSLNKFLKLFSIGLLVVAIALTVILSQQTQNITQKAAAPDQLEAEGGVLGGNATIVSDTSASGGQSILFAQSSATLTPTQGVSPTPTPVAGRPFPPPITTGTYTVPSTIDSTGTTDVTSALQSFITGVPSGSIISFKAGGTYRLTKGMLITRNNLVLEGNNATLHVYGTSEIIEQSPFYINGPYTDIEIKDFTLWGSSLTPGVFGGGEHQHGVGIRGGIRVNIHNVAVKAVFGDGVYVATNADNVWFHDATVETCGRMGVAITNGTNFLVERVHFDVVGYGLFDVEPNAGNVVNGVIYRNNTARKISLVGPNGFFFGANATASTGTSVSNVTVTNNTISEDLLYSYVTIADQRRKNITFTNNKSLIAGAGPILNFAHVDGLTVTGNIQPLTSGSLASITDSTNVKTAP